MEIRRRLKKLYDLIPAQVPSETRREQAAGAFACMVGGLILARALNESEGMRFLKDCHAFLREALAISGPESLTSHARRPPSTQRRPHTKGRIHQKATEGAKVRMDTSLASG